MEILIFLIGIAWAIVSAMKKSADKQKEAEKKKTMQQAAFEPEAEEREEEQVTFVLPPQPAAPTPVGMPQVRPMEVKAEKPAPKTEKQPEKRPKPAAAQPAVQPVSAEEEPMFSAEDIRKAVIMREVLDRPRALRPWKASNR